MADIIAIDIGGTNIKYGIVDHTGYIRDRGIVPTEAHYGGQVLIEKREGIIQRELNNTSNLLGIGISSAGQIDPKTVLYALQLITCQVGQVCPIKDILTSRFKVPVYVDNDELCCSREFWMGAAQNRDNIIMLTLGTGIGGAIIKEGRVFMVLMEQQGNLVI